MRENDEHPGAGCGSVVHRVAADWKMREMKSIQTRVDPMVLVTPEFFAPLVARGGTPSFMASRTSSEEENNPC